jgi:hypothetical protein
VDDVIIAFNGKPIDDPEPAPLVREHRGRRSDGHRPGRSARKELDLKVVLSELPEPPDNYARGLPGNVGATHLGLPPKATRAGVPMV